MIIATPTVRIKKMAPFREIYSWKKKNFSKGNLPDQMNVQRFPKLGEVIWPLSPRATGVNPYWIGDMDCTTPRKAVPFRERQPHALHTNRKSLSQQLDCSGGRTPVSAMGNHLKNRKSTLRISDCCWPPAFPSKHIFL